MGLVLCALLLADHDFRVEVRTEAGKPLAGAVVTFRSYDGHKVVLKRRRTGRDGLVKAGLPDARHATVWAQAPGRGLVAEHVPPERSSATLTLSPETPLKLRLLYPDGRPVVGQVVATRSVWKQDGDEHTNAYSETAPLTQGKTDATGTATLHGLSLGWNVNLECKDPRLATDWDASQAKVSAQGAMTLRLPWVYSVSGRVTREGKGVGGVEVMAVAATDGMALGRGLTRRDGTYRILKLAEGDYNVLAYLKGDLKRRLTARASETLSVGAGRPAPTADLLLIPGALVRVTVRDQEGRPLPGRTVGLSGPSQPVAGLGIVQATSDSKGLVEFRVPAGHQRIELAGEADPPRTTVEAIEGAVHEATLTVIGKPTRPVEVLIVDAKGNSVPGASVVLGTELARPEEGTTDQKGVAHIMAEGTGAFYVTACGSDGFAAAVFRTAQPNPVKVELQSAKRVAVTGRVMDDHGLPVAGASVSLSGRFEKFSVFSARTESDSEGRYAFPSVLEFPEVYVYVSVDGFSMESSRKPQKAGPLLDVVLRVPDQTVRGRVVDLEGRPVYGASVQCDNVLRSRSCTTDADGRFVLEGVPKGEAEVSARKGQHFGREVLTSPSDGITIKVLDREAIRDAATKWAVPPAEGSEPQELVVGTEWVNSEPLKLRDLRGKVVLLQFWGTWCGPCVAELPEIAKLHTDLPDVVIIGIHALKEISREKLEAFAKAHGATWPIAMDFPVAGEPMATTAAYGVRAFPTLVVIGRDGKVARSSRDFQELRKILLEELGKR